jgi:hypothetical protein
MGTWGPAIQSNDTSADIYYLFFDLLNKGYEVKEISEKLISENQETIEDPDDSNNFWLALAKCQWETGQLEPALLSRVENIITSGKDLAAWKGLGADQKLLETRRKKLETFLTLIQSENKKPKKRKKPPRQIFQKGECLAIKIKRNHSDITYYTGAIVLELDDEVNLVSKVGLQKLSLPVIEDFIPYQQKLNQLEKISDMFMGEYKLGVPGWYLVRTFKKYKENILSVGVLEISVSFGSSEETEDKFGINPDWMDIPFRRW